METKMRSRNRGILSIMASAVEISLLGIALIACLNGCGGGGGKSLPPYHWSITSGSTTRTIPVRYATAGDTAWNLIGYADLDAVSPLPSDIAALKNVINEWNTQTSAISHIKLEYVEGNGDQYEECIRFLKKNSLNDPAHNRSKTRQFEYSDQYYIAIDPTMFGAAGLRVGQTYWYLTDKDTRTIGRVSIEILASFDPFFTARTIEHELGHALGIVGHSSKYGAIMYASFDSEDTHLTDADISLIEGIYKP